MKNKFQEKIKKIAKKKFTAFCTCPPSGNQVDGLPLALVRMLCQLVGFGSIERASVKSDVFFRFLKRFLTLKRL